MRSLEGNYTDVYSGFNQLKSDGEIIQELLDRDVDPDGLSNDLDGIIPDEVMDIPTGVMGGEVQNLYYDDSGKFHNEFVPNTEGTEGMYSGLAIREQVLDMGDDEFTTYRLCHVISGSTELCTDYTGAYIERTPRKFVTVEGSDIYVLSHTKSYTSREDILPKGVSTAPLDEIDKIVYDEGMEPIRQLERLSRIVRLSKEDYGVLPLRAQALYLVSYLNQIDILRNPFVTTNILNTYDDEGVYRRVWAPSTSQLLLRAGFFALEPFTKNMMDINNPDQVVLSLEGKDQADQHVTVPIVRGIIKFLMRP